MVIYGKHAAQTNNMDKENFTFILAFMTELIKPKNKLIKQETFDPYIYL